MEEAEFGFIGCVRVYLRAFESRVWNPVWGLESVKDPSELFDANNSNDCVNTVSMVQFV